VALPILTCTGCSCTSTATNATASCTTVAYCYPEDEGIAASIGSGDLCPNGFPAVFNEATASGVIGGAAVLFESQATSIGPNLTCHFYARSENCDGSITFTGSNNDEQSVLLPTAPSPT
jgi:hypothetical protein